MTNILLFRGKSSQQAECDKFAETISSSLAVEGIDIQVIYQQGAASNSIQEISAHRDTADIVVVVGYSASVAVANAWTFDLPLICALPDIPSSVDAVYASAISNIENIATRADYLLVHDEASRSLIEYHVAGSTGRVGTLKDVSSIQRFVRKNVASAPRRILISSHDFRFINDVVHMLQRTDAIEVRLQKWDLTAEAPQPHFMSDIEWADTIICEWAGRNAVWFSHHKNPSQRLIVRLHGFEARSAWINDLNFEAVDRMIVVSRFYREKLIRTFQWNPEKIEAIGNTIDCASLNRPKIDGAQFHLGMLGISPLLKRPQAALEVFERLLKQDKRYVLHLRGESPWNHPWLWNDVRAADGYRQLYQRIGKKPRLRSRIVFEAPGSNIESWFSHIGWILSLSYRETFHLAAAEGMASGAVPVFLEREGVEEIFSDRWVFDSPQTIAEHIHSVVSSHAWADESQKSQKFAQQFDFALLADDWLRVILEV